MAGGRSRILIIDDNLEFLEMLVALLEPTYQVTLAENGKRGMALACSHQFDLVLLDIFMPGLDGFTVCQQLKRHEATRHLPVILMSGHLEAEGRFRAIDVGAADYIAKPFNLPMVNARIRVLIAPPIITLSQTTGEKFPETSKDTDTDFTME